MIYCECTARVCPEIIHKPKPDGCNVRAWGRQTSSFYGWWILCMLNERQVDSSGPEIQKSNLCLSSVCKSPFIKKTTSLWSQTSQTFPALRFSQKSRTQSLSPAVNQSLQWRHADQRPPLKSVRLNRAEWMNPSLIDDLLLIFLLQCFSSCSTRRWLFFR